MQEYALRITDSSDLQLQDLGFFGTTIYAAALTNQKMVVVLNLTPSPSITPRP